MQSLLARKGVGLMPYNIQHILYATDLGPHGPEVFRFAVSIAEKYGAAIHVLHVTEEPAYLRRNVAERYISSSVLGTYREATLDEAMAKIKQRLEQFSQSTLVSEDSKYASVADIKVMTGKPGATILNEADRINADCIIMGSRRYSGVSAITIGSVAREITRKSRRPVFLFPV